MVSYLKKKHGGIVMFKNLFIIVGICFMMVLVGCEQKGVVEAAIIDEPVIIHEEDILQIVKENVISNLVEKQA